MLPVNEFRWLAGGINTAVFYPWWGLGYSLLPLFTSWCVSWPLASTKKIANLQAIFGITKHFPIKKNGKGNKTTNFPKFSHRKKMVGEQIFQRNSLWKPMTSCLLCWGFKPGRPWTKPLSLVIRCCKAWRKSCGEAPRRSWSRRIFQSPWGVWSLEEITTHRTHPKVSFGTLKLKEWTKKDSKLKCWGGCCWMLWEAFGQITTKNAHPKDGFDGFALQFQSVTRGAQKRVLWYLPEITFW